MLKATPVEAYLNRYFQLLVAPYYYSFWTDWFGNGLGTATRAGAALGGGYGGAEVLGQDQSWKMALWLVYYLFFGGLWITKDLMLTCIKAVKRGSYLAIFLFGAAGPILLFGLLGQPTNLGFAAFGSGLCLAAAISKKQNY